MEKLVGLPTMNAFYLATVLIIKLIINCWLCYLAQLRLKVTGKQPEYFQVTVNITPRVKSARARALAHIYIKALIKPAPLA